MEDYMWHERRQHTHHSARDSLSPRRSYSLKDGVNEDELIVADGVVEDVGVADAQPGRCVEVQSAFYQFDQQRKQQQHINMTTTLSNTVPMLASSPRSSHVVPRRPFRLDLDDSRGATSVSPSVLRQLIKRNAAYSTTATSLQAQTVDHTTLPSPFPNKGRRKYPAPGKLIGTTLLVHQTNALPVRQQTSLPMGNQISHNAVHDSRALAATSSASTEDDLSTESMHPRDRSKLQPRKSSINVLRKKIVSKAEPPKNFTTTVIEVPRAATAPNFDLADQDEANWVDEKENRQIRHVKTLSAPSPALPSQPGSPVTITEARPLSAGTTVTGVSITDEDEQDSPSPAHLRVSALSPSIPTPTPLPEDSPHQYGLKDFVDTPSPPPPDPNRVILRSSGLDIFNDAKSLQTASSFLNGLSNARRRAESRARSTRSTTKSRLTSASTSNLPYNNAYPNPQAPAYQSLSHLPIQEPPSPTSSEGRPLTPQLDDVSRNLGDTHKSSGFAFAKPLSFVQLKCYRNHERLMRSSNRFYQVECAVCHKDEPSSFYWSCSWCAIRMCEVCRSDFRENGPKALKEKIRTAELGTRS